MALALSDDGTVVVGMSGYQPPTEAFIWTPETKMVKLSDYLTNKGVTGHETWTLVNANCVSPNGKIIAGTGINKLEQRVEGYIVRLPQMPSIQIVSGATLPHSAVLCAGAAAPMPPLPSLAVIR
jgi:hypothetical protein